MITDGVVHDIPASVAALGFDAPLHALITGHEGERQRRIELVEAPRYGIVGKDQVISARVLDSADRGEPVKLAVRRDGETIANFGGKVGERIDVKVPIEHAGPNVVELEVAPVADELATDSNRAVVNIEGVRDKLQVLLVSGKPHPGERMWRNSAEVGRQRRSRSFHHPAPAGKGQRRHADQRIVADRFSGRRPVRPKDQGFRPHHLRPLRAAVDPARRLSRQHRQLCARRRRVADGRGAGILHARRPLLFAARRDHAGGADGRGRRGALSSQGVRRGPAPSGDARARRLRRRHGEPAWGRWFRARRRKDDRRSDVDERPGRQTPAGALARRQGAGRPAAERPDVAVGARTTTAAAPTSTCCAASPIG